MSANVYTVTSVTCTGVAATSLRDADDVYVPADIRVEYVADFGRTSGYGFTDDATIRPGDRIRFNSSSRLVRA